MPKFHLEKLVRDQMPDIMKREDQTPVVHILQGQELEDAKLAKIIEEAKEAAHATNSEEVLVKELATIRELINSILIDRGIEESTIQAVQHKMNDAKGSFKEGRYLETVSVDESSEWTTYYRKEPERFLESKDGEKDE